MCIRAALFVDAKELCTDMGGRLCTVDELMRGESGPHACGYDSAFSWTWAAESGSGDACRDGDQALGVAGKPGAWFSFSATAAGVYQELRVQTDTESSFSINTDIIDTNGDRVVVSPIEYKRHDGIMLRWNTTQAGLAHFVHVTSPDLDQIFTIAVVEPPEYHVDADLDPKSWSHNDEKEALLPITVRSVVPVDLPFNFSFFGLECNRLWISSSGYITFERPQQANNYVGQDSTHSAVVAATGEFDLERSGASVKTSIVGFTAFEIAWHAPLFESSKFTDVAVRLGADGSIGLRWNRIVLDGSGSLERGLLSRFTFDSLPPVNSDATSFDETDPTAQDPMLVLEGGHASIVRSADVSFNLWNLSAPIQNGVKITQNFNLGPSDTALVLDSTSVDCDFQPGEGRDPDGEWGIASREQLANASTATVCAQLVATRRPDANGANYNTDLTLFDGSRGSYKTSHVWEHGFVHGVNCEAVYGMTGTTLPSGTAAEVLETCILQRRAAYVQLPPVVLGGASTISTWVRMGMISGGMTLFNSFQDISCGDSDPCRNIPPHICFKTRTPDTVSGSQEIFSIHNLYGQRFSGPKC
jgi:hypothetical protein